MPSAVDVLARLRDSADDAPSARLARLLVDDALGRPIRTLVDATRVAESLHEALLSATAHEPAAKRVARDSEALRVALSATQGPLAEAVPAPLRKGVRALVELPLLPSREVVLRVLDRPSLRQIVRAQLVDTLVDFGRKAASPMTDSAIGRGLGGLGKLAGQLARPSPLGAIAKSVSGEVERQIEKRATDFADTAVTGVIAGIADQMSDPDKAAQQAALRLDLIDGMLALSGVDVAALSEKGIERSVAIVREALAAWAKDAAFVTTVRDLVAAVVEREGDRPLGDVLGDLGLREPVAKHAASFLRDAIARAVAGDAFGTWLADVLV